MWLCVYMAQVSQEETWFKQLVLEQVQERRTSEISSKGKAEYTFFMLKQPVYKELAFGA